MISGDQMLGIISANEPGLGGASPTASMAVSPLLEEVKQRVLAKLTQQLQLSEVKDLPEARRREELRAVIERLLNADPQSLDHHERGQVIDDLLDEVLGLGPLEKLLRDRAITDILVNGPHEVYVERGGLLEESPVRFRDGEHLLHIIDRIVARVGRRIDETSPMVDARLPDGSRLNAIIPPLALKGPALSIRRFGQIPLGMKDLLERKVLAPEMALLLEACIRARLNIVISGGTGSGKTTLLNILSSFIPEKERIVTIEDAAELQLQQRHVVQLETRPPNVEGKGEVSPRDLVRNALRMRPDRIIVGECRGAEALDMLQAMNTGHEGSLTTLHANSPRDALSRLETMVLMAGYDIPLRAIRRQITSSINLIVQAERLQGGSRKVTGMTEVVGMEGETIVMQEIFAYVQSGIDPEGRAKGKFVATGVRPDFATRLRKAGVELPTTLFQERTLLRA
jgi:pilus assembly protein CpaF